MTSGMDEVNEALEQMRAFVTELQQVSDDLAVESAQLQAENRESELEEASKRRDGEFGPDWQTLQRRIDLTQTTVFDITSGMDKSPEARAVRETMGENIVIARHAMIDTIANTEPDSSLGELIAETEKLTEQLNETLSSFNASNPWPTS